MVCQRLPATPGITRYEPLATDAWTADVILYVLTKEKKKKKKTNEGEGEKEKEEEGKEKEKAKGVHEVYLRVSLNQFTVLSALDELLTRGRKRLTYEDLKKKVGLSDAVLGITLRSLGHVLDKKQKKKKPQKEGEGGEKLAEPQLGLSGSSFAFNSKYRGKLLHQHHHKGEQQGVYSGTP